MLFTLFATALGVDLPPMPTVVPMHRNHKSAAVERGAGAKALAPAPKAVVPPTPVLVLAWTWLPDTGNPASNIVFLVRSATVIKPCAPTRAWPIVGTTTALRWTNTINKSASGLVLFSVTASNQVSYCESGFATK
jgi:hypothetical protein